MQVHHREQCNNGHGDEDQHALRVVTRNSLDTTSHEVGERKVDRCQIESGWLW